MRDPYNGQPAEFLFEATDNRGFPGRFRYWKGSQGHVFIENVPKNLELYYGGGYQTIPSNEAELAEAASGDAYRLEPIKALVPTGSFLEIGSWIGMVAYSAKKAGYKVTALERDDQCVDLMGRSGIEAIQTTEPAVYLSKSGRTFDVVGLWHSIEHLPRPWEVVEAAARAVAPGGILVIATPNPESAQMRVLGSHWLHLDAPRHLHLLPASMIEEIGQRAGLEVVSQTSDDHLGSILDRDGWMFNPNRLLEKIPILRKVVPRLPLHLLANLMFRKRGALDGAGYTMIMMRPRERRPRRRSPAVK